MVARAILASKGKLEKQRRSADAWGEYGEVLLAHEFYQAARIAFAEAGRLAPTEAKWPYLEGRSFDVYVTDEAAAPLEKAAQLAGDKPDAPALTLIELYLAVDRPTDAKARLEPFLVRYPTNARANLAMARLLLKQGDAERALHHARQAERDPATHKGAHQLIGQIYLRQGQADEARKCQQLAEDLVDRAWPDPYFAEVSSRRTGLKALLVQVDRMFGAGQVKETIPLLERAVQEYPDSDWAHVLLGRSLIREKRYSEAEKALRRAVGLAPESAEAQFRLGVVMSRQNRQLDAADWFRRAVKLKPDFTMAHYNLGQCLLALRDSDGAIEAFQAAADSDPTSYDLQTMLGALYAQQGRTEDAVAHWKQALALRPDDAKATEELQKLTASSAP